MESPQSVVSPLKTSLVVSGTEKNNGTLSNDTGTKPKEHVLSDPDNSFIGLLDVHVHQARDIHNICIYHKQDVYAKLCLTSDPENTMSTKIINGGGRNPVFDDNLRLDVRTVDCSLKCEIFMMSRVRNYLEDQLLGFTLVPVSEVLLKNGKLEKEFSLSSTDLFHSPAGFVQLSLSYTGASPDVMAIPPIPAADETTKNSGGHESIPSDLGKIEFPDPNIVNENQMMVSEYFGISESSESVVASDATENQMNSETRGPEMKSFNPVEETPKRESPKSSVSTNGVSSPSIAVSSDSSDPQEISKAPNQEKVSGSDPKEKSDVKTASLGKTDEPFAKPVLTVNVEPEQNVVQQDIVDMYMKSMQQFTESLAKMKLPLDVDSPTKSENSTSSDPKLQTPKSAGSRVFYGSRAFF